MANGLVEYMFEIGEEYSKDRNKIDQLIKDIQDANIPIKNIQDLVDDRRGFYNLRPRIIDKIFDILFVPGKLKYDREKSEFELLFNYSVETCSDSPDERIKGEILLILGLDGVSEDLEYNLIRYKRKVNPVTIDNIKQAYQEIEMVDRKLKLAPRISRTINHLLIE